MAGARGKLRKTPTASTPKRSTRNGQNFQRDGVPAVFQEMLSEEEAADFDEDERPLKKRKTASSQSQAAHSQRLRPPKSPSPAEAGMSQSQVPSHQKPRSTVAVDETKPTNGRVLQTVIDSDESDESDMEWEDALGDEDEGEDEDEDGDVKATPQIGDVSITIGAKKVEEKDAKKKIRRRAITSVDKKRRLDIHKMHLLCLLYHVHRRNAWCNDRRVQSTLRKIVSPQTLSNLVPDPTITQYSASKRFIDAMNELKMLWSKRFKITAQGMYKPRWAEADAEVRPFSDFHDLDDPMDKDDFRNAAHTLQGSQDIGAQLFCALLRAIGIEVRVVCSLQPLPFASAAERATPQKSSAHKTVVIDPFNKPAETSPIRPKTNASARHKKLSRLERVMGERHAVLNKTGVALKKEKAYHTPYPVYWVEAFNPSHQKWVPIDTHSTFSVNAPEKIEPPLTFAQNSLTYAVAFDEDYTAKDVTRRYARAYNAKTRKFRVECTPTGDKWWRRTLKFFRRSTTLDRDQVEDAALARKEAAEGMPKNVQDFKGHPVYVLERHLRHNEVIHPLTQVGKINCGSAMNPKIEPIYRRNNVHTVRSSDKWYRMGRDIKEGEQPLKHAKPKKGKQAVDDTEMEIDDQQDDTGAGLYAEFQTELYIPPPVIKGRVPRNAYGNLDLYVPSMCPAGGTHIRHKLASKAARILSIDFADAVTGFSFKGRHGTAIVQGVVVAQQYVDAVQAVLDGMEYQQEEAELAARRAESLRLWRRFCLGLRIAQRINAIVIDGERGPTIDVQTEISKQDRELAAKEMAGGFFPDEDEFEAPQPSRRDYEPPQQEYGDGGFLPDDGENDVEGGGFMPEDSAFSLARQHSFESSILDSQQLRPRRQSSLGAVYSSEEEDDFGGGLILDTSPSEAGLSAAKPSHPEGGSRQPDNTAENAGGFVPENSASPNQQPDIEQEKPEVPPANETTTAPINTASPSPSPVLSDTGSLPFEDPEDEDADPEWLVDVT